MIARALEMRPRRAGTAGDTLMTPRAWAGTVASQALIRRSLKTPLLLWTNRSSADFVSARMDLRNVNSYMEVPQGSNKLLLTSIYDMVHTITRFTGWIA